ncbi:MAG: hypothetical protein Q8L88_02220 [Bacteroidota bacterium]|nr:hypothetical protein [Bacteroidota bacterium]
MRITATEQFLMAARAAGRTVEPKISIKKTASRSELLSAGTWIDVTDYISKKNIPTVQNDLEINLSQFSANSISLTGLDISFWDANYFNYANFLEVKFEYILSGLTSEAVPVFAGWIKKKKSSFVVKRFERPNTVTFDVWSYADYADEIHASSLVAQYIEDDIDDSGTDGLVLPHIRNLFVTDANITLFVMKKGIHIISYQIAGANKQAKLDDGEWTTLTVPGYTDLPNGDITQKIKVYARPNVPTVGEFSDDIIVDTPTDAFPKNWYSSISAQFLLLKLFEKSGIATLSVDTLEYPTFDGNPKVSFLDVVPNDISLSKNRDAIVGDGTYLYFGVANKFYRRNMNSGVYTLKQTLASGANILKMECSAANDHIWIFCSNGYLYRYTISTDTLSAAVNLTTNVHYGTVLVADFPKLHSAGNEYCIVYNNFSTGKIRRVDGASLADTEIGTGTGYYLGGAFFENGTYRYWIQHGSGYRQWQWNGSADDTWQDNGTVLTLTYAYDAFAYHPGEARIYFLDLDASTPIIKSHTLSSATESTIATLGAVTDNFNNNVRMYYSAVYGAVFVGLSDKNLRKIISNAQTIIYPNIQNRFSTFVDHNSRLYGVDIYGRLYHYADVVALYVETADFEGMTVRGAIDFVCSSYNLVYKISSTKSARVQRRSDENGDVITSGSSIALTSDNLKDVSDDSFYGDAYDIIKVSNTLREVNYDGSIYDAVAFDQEKVFPLESALIPDEILEDLAFNLYPFFSVHHKVCVAPSPAALMQYECLDGATIVHTGKMTLNETGVIVSDSVDKFGKPQFKVLVNA